MQFDLVPLVRSGPCEMLVMSALGLNFFLCIIDLGGVQQVV